MASLVVTVIEARDVPKMDVFTKSDPYVVLQVGHQTFRTQYKPNTDTPFWNETFTWPVVSGREELVITLWDKDVRFDDKISTCGIPLGGLGHGATVDSWFSMEPVGRVKKGGQIHLRVQLLAQGAGAPVAGAPSYQPGYGPQGYAGAGGYAQPPGAGGYAPPPGAGGYAPPPGAGGYAPPPGAGGYGPPAYQQGGYPPAGYGPPGLPPPPPMYALPPAPPMYPGQYPGGYAGQGQYPQPGAYPAPGGYPGQYPAPGGYPGQYPGGGGY